jgi:hypothetical protein
MCEIQIVGYVADDTGISIRGRWSDLNGDFWELPVADQFSFEGSEDKPYFDLESNSENGVETILWFLRKDENAAVGG